MNFTAILFILSLAILTSGGYGEPRNRERGSTRGRQSWRNQAQNSNDYDQEPAQSTGGFGASPPAPNSFGADQQFLDEDEDGIQQNVETEDFSEIVVSQKGHKNRPTASTTIAPTNKPVRVRVEEPEVKTPTGTFRGKIVTGGNNGQKVVVFLGIPFAKPPVGDLRFKKPVPSEQLSSPFQATELPNACMQRSIEYFGGFEGEQMWNPNTNVSEDCLYLNIWIPQTVYEQREQELVTVLFWIYGGGFFSGSSALDVYNGATLASEEDVVVVSAQYRLGPLGFLYLGTEDAPGNMGLWDQNLALHWVHENIDGFGGDPNSVTLFGESAGSASVGFHMVSPKSRSYFKRGVMMSGIPVSSYSYVQPNILKTRSSKLAELAGCDPNKSPKEVASCLRNLDPQVLIRLSSRFYKKLLEFPFVPTMDGDFLPDHPNNLIEHGEAKRAELMIGTVADEGSYFLLYQYLKYFHHLKPTSVNRDRFEDILREVFENYSGDEQDAIITYYTNWENPEDGFVNQNGLMNALGDALFLCPIRQFAESWSNRGLKVFYYHFTQRSSANPWGKWMGVMHGDEIPFVFGKPLDTSHSPPYTVQEKQLTSFVMRLLGNFAKIGTPSDKWERYTSEAPVYLDLNATVVSDETSSQRFGPRANPCAFWNRLWSQAKVKGRGRGRESTNSYTDETPQQRRPRYSQKQHRNCQEREEMLESCQPPRRNNPCDNRGVHGGRGFHETSNGRGNDCESSSQGQQWSIPVAGPKNPAPNSELPTSCKTCCDSEEPEYVTPPPF